MAKVVYNIRKIIYQCVMLPQLALLFIVSIPRGISSLYLDRLEKQRSIITVPLVILGIPLIPLFIFSVISSLVLCLLINTSLVVTKIALFPELFLSLWFKEGIKLNRVLSLSVTQFSSMGMGVLGLRKVDDILSDLSLYQEDFKDFLEVENSKNRKLLVELLKNNQLSIQKVIFYHKHHSELIKNVATQIFDKEKSKFVFDYLGLNDLKPFISQYGFRDYADKYGYKYGYKYYYSHPIYHMNIGVINDIDMGLLKTLLIPFIEQPGTCNALALFHVIDLLTMDPVVKHNVLVKNLSGIFSNEKALVMQMIKRMLLNLEPGLFCKLKDESTYVPEKWKIENICNMTINLRRLILKKDLIENLPCNLDSQSTLFQMIKDFLESNMEEQSFDEFTKIIMDQNCIENLKHIDNLRDAGAFPDNTFRYMYFLRFRTGKTIYDSDLKSAHLLLKNTMFFDRLMAIPTKTLKDIFSTRLYKNYRYCVNKILAFFDCLDDNSKNKNILHKLQAAFEKDSESTMLLVNSSLFNGHYYNDGRKIKELLENSFYYRLLLGLKQNFFFCMDNSEINYVLNPETMVTSVERDISFLQRINVNDRLLFLFLLKEVIKTRNKFIFSTIMDVKSTDLYGTLSLKMRHKIGYLIFSKSLFTSISSLFKSRVSTIALPLFKSNKGPHITMEENFKKILKIKFIDLFVTNISECLDTYSQIQELTLEDLSTIENIEEFLKDKGVTNLHILTLLTTLIIHSIDIVNKLGDELSKKEKVIQTICDTFENIPVNNSDTVPSLLELCKTSIMISSLSH